MGATMPPSSFVFVSCRVPEFPPDRAAAGRADGLRELYRRVAALLARASPGEAVWVPSEGGGHLALAMAGADRTALEVVAELRSSATEASVPLRLAVHRGAAEAVEGPDGRPTLHGLGLREAEQLLALDDQDQVLASAAFVEAAGPAGLPDAQFHDELLTPTPGGDPVRVLLLSMAGRFRSAWGDGPGGDRACLERAVRQRKAWDAVYYAKRLLQVNAADVDGLQALENLRDRDLIYLDGRGEEEINPVLGSMDRHCRVQFIRAAQLVERGAGDVLCQAQEEGDTMFLILRGEVGVFPPAAGGGPRATRPVVSLRAGEVVGELAYALHRPRTAALQCFAPTALLAFQYQQMNIHLSGSPFLGPIEERMGRFLNERVLEYVCNNKPFLVGKDRSGPLAKFPSPWGRLLPRAAVLHCTWQQAPVISRDDERFRTPGIYLLVSGQLQDTANPQRRLHDKDVPVVYAEFPGHLAGGNARYKVEEDVRIVRIAADALQPPAFDPKTFRAVIDGLKAAAARQFSGAPDGPADEAFSSHTVLVHYPAPVALAYQRICHQRDPAQRLDRLFKALEAMLKYLTFLGLSDLFHRLACSDRPPTLLHPELEFLRKSVPLTLGKWVAALREVSRLLAQQPDRFVQELPAVCRPGGHFDQNILGWIVANRNLVEHPPGALPLTAQEYQEKVRQVRPKLEEAYQLISFVRSYPLGFATEGMAGLGAGGVWRYHLHSCMGARIATTAESYSLSLPAPLAAHTPFVVSPDGSRLLYLWPWLLEQVGEHSGSHSLYAFERIAAQSQFLASIHVAAIDQRDTPEKELHRGQPADHAWLLEALRALPAVVPLTGDPRVADNLLPARGGKLVDRDLDANLKVVAKIASGGFSTVYAAKTADGRCVAVKVLEDRERSQHYPRFRQEIETLRRAGEHPGIIRCYEAGTVEVDGQDYPWYAMEYAVADLRARIRERQGPPEAPLPWDNPHWRGDVIHEFQALAAAVAHLHGLGIIHRDVKPGNVLIGEDGGLRLADFGLVRSQGSGADRAAPVTSVGGVLGTRRYMAPEQERAEEVGPPADVYALGVVLAELALGRWPDPDTRVPQGSTLRQSPLVSRLPAPLQRFLHKCTDAHPGKRYPDAQAMSEEFASLSESIRTAREV
jgi:hypothetical protein